MLIRSFHLPQDIDLMNSLVVEGFQYPENPAWSVQSDEMEGMLDRVKGMKRMWPVLALIRAIFPDFRDVLCGFIAEEDGCPVGLINYMRHSNEPEWYIANVTVLPAYRGKGIARQLVAATLQELRNRKAEVAFLEVVAGNLPAINLYKDLGFDAYTSMSEYDFSKNGSIADEPLPPGYRFEKLRPPDWRTAFDFAKRVTPEHIARYERVTEKRFRRPFFRLLLGKIIEKTGNTHNSSFAVRSPKDEVVGLLHINYRTRPGGVNHAEFKLDPAHPELAPSILRHGLSLIQKASPSQRIQLYFEDWQPALSPAAEAIGCEKRFGACRMGLFFDKS